MRQPAPWLIYALGGGWGHLNRAIALGRIAAAHSPVHILTNSPYAAQVGEELERWRQQGKPVPTLLIFPATLEKAALCRQVQAYLLSTTCRCLIVDTFPRGLGGELADLLPRLSCPKVLIHRDLSWDYVRSHHLPDFVARHYDSIIIPGEGAVPLASLPLAHPTPPWLIYGTADLAEAFQSQVSSPDQGPEGCLSSNPFTGKRPLILVCAAGNAAEQAFFGTLTHQLQQAFPHTSLRCLSASCPPGCPPALWLQAWPGLPWVAQATVVVGGGGYNTVYECAALKKPLIAFAWPRLYDCQARRLSRYGTQVSTNSEAIAQVNATLQSPQNLQPPDPNPRPCTPYPNGATDAFRHIQRLTDVNPYKQKQQL
ncbi:MAG: hypothetical protein ICV62_14930 [Cyanobacteria bacterium Co-bin13]|nr:hypothetical protein [Cyanobacteria bacterium Co-bin13]